MTPKDVFAKLQGRFADSVYDFAEGGDPKTGVTRDGGCKVKSVALRDVMAALRDDPELRCDFLQCISAVDWLKQGVLQVVYHLFSYPHRHSFVVKVDLPRDNAVVASMVPLWSTADWLEREQFDLYGVQFDGHPDLRRLLMPDDWEGYPMRKDYKEQADYRGMPTTRYSPLELLVAYDKANPQVEGQRPGGAAPPAPAAPKKEGT
jgi:NADH-quinone oxidoreductase subunit C